MRALVTGGAGFIGCALAKGLLDAGNEVVVLDRLDARVHGAAPPLPDGVALVQGDVRNGRALDLVLEGGVDVVFHEAAVVGQGGGKASAAEYVDTNVRGTEELLRAAARAPRPPERVVLASSMAVYGEGLYRCRRCAAQREGTRREEHLRAGWWEPRCPECGEPLVPEAVPEDGRLRPQTAYAVSKLEQEKTALALGTQLRTPVVALRYHNVYGPLMARNTPYAGVASLFKSRLLAGLPPLVHEDGGQLRDFIHVDDVVSANLAAAAAPLATVAFKPFNVATGKPRPVVDLALSLAAELAPDLRPELPGTFRPGDPRHIFESAKRAEAVLGFRARVPFVEGVRAFARAPMRAAVEEVPA